MCLHVTTRPTTNVIRCHFFQELSRSFTLAHPRMALQRRGVRAAPFDIFNLFAREDDWFANCLSAHLKINDVMYLTTSSTFVKHAVFDLRFQILIRKNYYRDVDLPITYYMDVDDLE